MNALTFSRSMTAAAVVAALAGCNSPTPAPPAIERFFFVAEGLPAGTRGAVYQAVTDTIGQIARPGEYVTVVSTPGHTPVATVRVPAGSMNARLRKPAIRRELHAIAQFFEEERPEGSSQAGAAKIASTIRALRRTDLPLRVVVVADPVYQNVTHPTWSMVDGKVPRDGSVAADHSPWRVTQQLPEGAGVAWVTPTATFGDDVFHQEAITRWYRRYVAALGGELDCVTPNARLALRQEGSQFARPLGDLDDGAGMRLVVSVADTNEPADEPTEAPTDTPIDAPVETPVDTKPPIDWFDTPPSALRSLRGDLSHVVLVRDLSSSMIVDSGGADGAHINERVVSDMTSKILGIPCRRFAVIGFGGQGEKGNRVRLHRHPWFLWSPVWANATPESRKLASEAIGRWEVGGGTSTLAGLRETRRLEGVTSVILWSDGLPSIGGGADAQQEVLDLLDEFVRDGIVVNTIGVGNLSSRGGGELDLEGCQFLKRIADKTGGAYLAL